MIIDLAIKSELEMYIINKQLLTVVIAICYEHNTNVINYINPTENLINNY